MDVQFPEFRKELWGQADEVVKYDLRRQDEPFSQFGSVKDLLCDGDWVFQFAAQMGGVGIFHGNKDYEFAKQNSLIGLNVMDALSPNQRMFFPCSACAYPIDFQKGYDKYDGSVKERHVLSEDLLGGGPADQLYGEEKRYTTMLMEESPLDARSGILSTVYGPYQEYEGERMKFPTAITRKVIEAKKTGEVEIWGDGTQIRTFLFIQDALEKIYRVMNNEKYEGAVNIGSDEEVTVQEIADDLCDYAGIKPRFIYRTDKPTGVLARSSDNSKFNGTYGTVPQTSARDGMRQLYDWMSKVL